MFKKGLIFFSYILIVSSHILFGQTNKIEVLKTVFNKAKTQLQTIDAALAICSQYYSLNADTLYHYALLAKKIAIDLHDKEKQVFANTFIENYLNKRHFYDSALHMCNNDLQGLNYQSNGEAYTKTMQQKCRCLYKSKKDAMALDCAYTFLADAEKYNDTRNIIFAKMMLCLVYHHMDQTDWALHWAWQADSTTNDPLYESVKNEFEVYNQLGYLYNWKMIDDANLPDKRRDDSLKSVYFSNRTINDSRKDENLFELVSSLNIKAATISTGDIEEEGRCVKECVDIASQLHDAAMSFNAAMAMCNYYIDEHHPEKGVEVSKEQIKIALQNSRVPILACYEKMADCYLAGKNYPKYAETLNAIIGIKDSLYKVNTEEDLAGLNAKYQDQKKENTIIQQKLDITAKQNTMYIISILCGILFVSILFLYRYYHRKQKAQKQKETIVIAAAEEAERKRISADLHDNIGAYAAAAASTIATIDTNNEKTKAALSQLSDNVQDMITQLNDSIWTLNKKAIYLTGISDRFKLFIQKLELAYPDVDISLEENIEYDRLLSPFQTLHLFRIMQEGLNNALRHSKCNNVLVSIFSNEEKLQISISDDGIGMNNTNPNGNGVNNLRERAKESGWNALWANNKGRGTSVIIST